MPSLQPDSSDLPKPSATPSSEEAAGVAQGSLRSPPKGASLSWRTNAWLFVATVASCFITWMWEHAPPARSEVFHAIEYTAALMAILLAHEFGHYIAARIHKVGASLPYFIPLPLLSPFGTMGAVIRMRSAIPTRRALLDIGAAGPLAGLALAIPLYAWGVAHSEVITVDASGGGTVDLGTSLLLRLLDTVFAPPVPEGKDVLLSPVAFAGWVGMFVTMINLLPVGQLDGGHVAYALFGPRQNKAAQWAHRSMLAFFFVSLASFVARDLRAGVGFWHIGRHVNNSLFWLVSFEVLAVLGSVSSPPTSRPAEERRPPLDNRTRLFATLGLAVLAGIFRERTGALLWVSWFAALGVLLAMEARWGSLRPSSVLLDHPTTGEQPLSRGRAAIAILTLAFLALLFMPTPISF
jgi:membrane-associated protease RseP (regulator of RpoE activity)